MPINNPYKYLRRLISNNNEMNLMNYCPKNIGEDYPDEECDRSVSIDISYQTKFFILDVQFFHRFR